MISALLDRYIAGAELPAKAIAGLTTEELNSHPVAGKWSVQQVIAHLVDSDTIGADRMKRIAAMPRPLLIGYDESAFADAFAQDRVDPKLACDLFRVSRLHTAALFRHLPDAAWDRWGVHSERGKVVLRDMLKDYCDHLDHHLRFIDEKRRALGKPAR